MDHNRYIGHVGGLAVALGIGAALVTAPWTAFATPSDGASSSTSPTAGVSREGAVAPPPGKGARSDSPGFRRSTAKRSTGSTTKSPKGHHTLVSGGEEPAPRRAVQMEPDVPNRAASTFAVRSADPAEPSGDTVRVPLWARGTESARGGSSETTGTAGGSVAEPVEATTGQVANRADDAVEPSPAGAPVEPVEAPGTWTLFAFTRRESASVIAKHTSVIATPAGQRTTESTSGIVTLPEPTGTWPPADFTGKPSTVSNVFSSVFQFVGDVGTALHVDLTIPVTRLLSSARPPRWTTVGLTVQRSQFDGMRVWTLQSPDPSGKYVVGVHGGGVVQPVIFNWLDYASIARDTGATVIVPLYPLVRHGGTAATIVPVMADLIAAQIDQRGADNVSVYGDSAGGQMLFPAVQELVHRGSPVPYRMVLSSPVVDATFDNPAIPLVNDAIFRGAVLSDLHKIALRYADGLDLADPLVSPLYGSLEGLPPTTIYAGSRDITAPGIVALRDKAAATPGADFTFVLRKGEPHDWAIVTIFPETKAGRPYLYQQLGIISAP